MKKLFTALLLLVGFVSFSQTTGYFRYDSVRLEKVGGNSELILLNSTRDSLGFLYNIGNGRTRFKTLSSLGIASKVANGVKRSVDTLLLGDSLDRFTYIQVLSHLTDGTRLNQLRLGNLPFAQSVGASTPTYPYAATYNPAIFAWDRLYSEANHDTAYYQYGGALSGVTRFNFDSVGIYGASLARPKEIVMPSQGVEALYQINLPRDTVRWAIARDGQQASVFVGQMDWGQTWGYNVNTYSTSNIPDMPISIYKANLDFQRNIDNQRRYKMTGVGVAQYLSAYKTYQSTINGSTYEVGDYVGRVVGFDAYGTMYPLLSTNTKAKTLAVSTVDTSIGFMAHPQYRYTNDIRNGYGFVAQGDSDFNHVGFLNIGPYSTFPTRANGGNTSFADRLYITGNMRATGNTYAFVTQAYGFATTIPIAVGTEAGITFQQTDSAQAAVLGTYLSPSDRNARGGYWRSEMYNGATMDNNQTGGFLQWETGVNHANITRQWRNGNFEIGAGPAMDAYRLYKKLAVGGSALINDTLTLKNLILRATDSTNLKPLVADATGNVYKGYWGNAAGGGISGLTVGTTTITSGTTTRILYDNAGTLGEYTISGSGNVAMTTSPTFTTPDIGTPSAGTLTNTTGYLWNNIANPTGTQSLSWADGVLNSWTNGSNTETFHTVDNPSLTTGISYKWNTSSITTGNLLSLVSTSTAANGFSLLNINSSQANANSSRTATGAIISVTNTGTTSTNYGLQVTASGASNNWGIQSTPNILINSPTLNANDALIIQSRTNTLSHGIMLYANNLTVPLEIGYGALSSTGNFNHTNTSGAISFTPTTGVMIGTSAHSGSATALLHLSAGSTSKAPMRFTSGSLATGGNILAGNVEFLTDKWYGTTTTGPAQYEFTMNNAALTTNRIPYVSNGRLTDAGTFLFDGSKFTLQGALQFSTAQISTTTTLTSTHYVVRVDASGGAVTVDLPDATACQGRVYVIKLISSSANAMTIDGNGTQTIDGSLTLSTSTQYTVYQIQSNGTNWDRLN